MKKPIAFAILFSFLAYFSVSQETAITSTGKILILNESGQWEEKKAENKSAAGFRNVPWGSDSELIEKTEKEELVMKDEKMLMYKTRVADFDCSALFILNKNILTRGRYYFLVNHKNENGYIDDYEKLKKILTGKYGEPTES